MKLNPLIVFRDDFGDEAVLFNSDNGNVLGLNRTGSFIWHCLEKSMERAEILNALKEACGDTLPADTEKDVDAFLGKLRDRNILIE